MDVINERFSNGYGVVWEYNFTFNIPVHQITLIKPGEFPIIEYIKSRKAAERYFNKCVDQYIK